MHVGIRRTRTARLAGFSAIALIATLLLPSAVAGSYTKESGDCDSSSGIVKVCIYIRYNVHNGAFPSSGTPYGVDAEQYRANVTRLDSTIALTGLQMSGSYFGKPCSGSWSFGNSFNSSWITPGNAVNYYFTSPWAGDYVMMDGSGTGQGGTVNIRYSRGSGHYSTSNAYEISSITQSGSIGKC